jgi:RNA polymerase sigma factor (sigma-70 family)
MDYASSREDRSEKKPSGSDSLIKDLANYIALTNQSWNEYESGESSIESYKDRLYVNADSLILAVTQRRLLSPYAALASCQNYFFESCKELDSILAELNIPIAEIKDKEFSLPPKLMDFETSIRIPLTEFVEIRERVEKIRSFISPLRDRFIEVNIPLVRKCAEKKRFNGLDKEDLVQYGCQGLIIALENFDLCKNVQFSTFAFPWINQSILKGIADNYHRGISVPKALQNHFIKISRAADHAKGISGLTPSPTELSGTTGIPLATIEKALAIPRLNISTSFFDRSANSENPTILDVLLSSLSAERSKLREEIELLRASLIRLPLLVPDSHSNLFISTFNLKEFAPQRLDNQTVSHQSSRFINRITLELVTCSALILERSKAEILKIVRGISPANLAIVLNFKSDSPLPLQELIDVPLIANEFRRGKSLFSPKQTTREHQLDSLMARSKQLINQIGNLITWNSVSEAECSQVLTRLSKEDQELFSLYMSRYFDSVKLFCAENNHSLKRLGAPTAPGEVAVLLTKIALQIMPELRKCSLSTD